MQYSLPQRERQFTKASSVPMTHFARSLQDTLRLIVATIIFALFCMAAIIGTYYFSLIFKNDSYKLVSFFLILIVISNVTSKYIRWWQDA